jgi:hypothetical protein
VRLVWAVPCDSYELHDDGTAHIFSAGFDAFQVEALPADLELKVILGLLLEEGEEAELEVHVIGPHMTGVRSLMHPITAEPGPLHRPGNFVSQVEAIEIEYSAEAPGEYVLLIYDKPVTDDLVSSQSNFSFFFSVVEGLP